MKKYLPLFIAGFLALSCSQGEKVTVISSFPTDAVSTCYQSNLAPLQKEQLIKLPTGSIKPGGWLLKQLELQKDGLNGHLGEISIWLDKKDNAWLKTGGQWGWEEVPYWLKGYSSLAYIFEDKDMLAETKVWIDAILNSQLENGNFGPSSLTPADQIQDLWPNMIALWILQDYYEYSGDERVIPFMTRYCHFLLTIPEEKFLKHFWDNSRAGDNLWSVAWLYNRTGDKELIELGKKIHRNAARWGKDTELPNWHNVNIAQCFREPATYYLFSGDKADIQGTRNSYSLIRRAFGQVPGGMWGGDENSRIGFFDPRQGIETCAIAEQMASDEILTLITGDISWAENCEDVAFNTYPAAFMPDMKALRYITCPNMAISDSKNHRPGIDNGGPFLAMNPFSSRCCQHNHGFGWPYYSEFLAMASPDNGIAFTLFSECEVTAKVGAEAKEFKFKEETEYPFDENIQISVSGDGSAVFPVYVRIPSWCRKAKISRNGRTIAKNIESGRYARIEAKWSDGDVIEIKFPMSLTTREWDVNKHSVSVDYGPLTLSLMIGEDYRRIDTETTVMGDSRWQEDADPEKWPSYEIHPTTDWNYALATDADITIERKDWPADNNPFTLDSCPLRFKAKGRLVPSWGIDEYGLTGVLPFEDAEKSDKVDEITLVPMGAARLRISAFPTCTAR